MPRYLFRGIQIVLDLAMLSIAYWLGYLFRFEFTIPTPWVHLVLAGWGVVVGLEYLALAGFGVPRMSWRYIGTRDVARIGVAMAVATALVAAIRISVNYAAALSTIPLGVISMNMCLAFLLLVAMRASRRVYGENRERKTRSAGGANTRALLYGAGQAGVLVAREIASRPDLGLTVVGYIDDDPLKIGTHIHGLPVLGRGADLSDLVAKKRVSRVLITIANARGAEIRRITMLCRMAGIETKIIPGIYEIVGEQVNLSRIREVAIEDLLGREPVRLDEQQVSDTIQGQMVMVTGAGGSIGSELCRQVCRFRPARLILVERFENALFEIHRELESKYPEVTLDARIADVTDATRMERIFSEFPVTIVYHAAAHKHVPMMELNPGEAIKNNIGGTRIVADLADRFAVPRFVLISTDKAVNPTSVMGATKRAAESYVQALAHVSKTRFVTVRFGNVLGSNGSAIPIFKRQIAAGGPVTITHPEMQRYFMTIPEASQLVLQASGMGQGGEIFILDMGEPVKIVDLARDLITLSGLRPETDIEIRFTGVRPGEKLFEELATDAEHADKTKHPKIFIGHIAPASLQEVKQRLDSLFTKANDASPSAVRAALATAVPDYTSPAKPLHHMEPRRAHSQVERLDDTRAAADAS